MTSAWRGSAASAGGHPREKKNVKWETRARAVPILTMPLDWMWLGLFVLLDLSSTLSAVSRVETDTFSFFLLERESGYRGGLKT
jgi:hypothetical protein